MARFRRLLLLSYALSLFLSVSLASGEQGLVVERATFAGGCFWCMEAPFEELNGAISVVSGYTGGSAENANYESIGKGTTQHREAIQITFDPSKISYEEILASFWQNIDPFDSGGQFCDRGFQYSPAIFTHDDGQRKSALASKKKLADTFTGKEIAVPILRAKHFYPAEDYHQDYYRKNPKRYKAYRNACKRDARLKEIREMQGFND